MLHCIRFKISLESEFKAKQIQSKTRQMIWAGRAFRFESCRGELGAFAYAKGWGSL
ncbi:TPA: hypothetical protein R1X62_000820 [Campylobacter upsaliensis]|nr:hypothetical protein [Campylobacter upsaliensis]HEC1581465.1 hypothetical protein [Campylobacter upsaliensis]